MQPTWSLLMVILPISFVIGFFLGRLMSKDSDDNNNLKGKDSN